MLKCTGHLSESNCSGKAQEQERGVHLPFSGTQGKGISLSPGNAAAHVFQGTVHTGASSQLAPGQMPLLKVPNMDFFIGLVEEH